MEFKELIYHLTGEISFRGGWCPHSTDYLYLERDANVSYQWGRGSEFFDSFLWKLPVPKPTAMTKVKKIYDEDVRLSK